MRNDSKPRSTAIWRTRRDYSGGYARCVAWDKIQISDGSGHVIEVGRLEARLLARRINQCLDDTVKR